MATYLWLGDTGWPTAEGDDAESVTDVVDLDGEVDLDALSLHAPPPHLWDDLTPLEVRVVRARFGMDGDVVRSLRHLHDDGIDRAQVRATLDSALAKLRDRLAV
jgi:DNA-directed RNA polymerase sigma subunit (sigma70/sigma32)